MIIAVVAIAIVIAVPVGGNGGNGGRVQVVAPPIAAEAPAYKKGHDYYGDGKYQLAID